MITMMDVYWITRLDGLAVFFTVTTILSVFILVGLIVDGNIVEDDWLHHKKLVITLSAVLLVATFGLVFIPKTNEAIAIYLVPKIANNEQVQKLPDNAMRFLNDGLEAWIKGLMLNKDKKK